MTAQTTPLHLPTGATRFVCFVYIIVGTDVPGGPLKFSLLNLLFLFIISTKHGLSGVRYVWIYFAPQYASGCYPPSLFASGCYPVFMCLFCLPQRGKGDRFAVDEVYFSLLNFLFYVHFLVSPKKKENEPKEKRAFFFIPRKVDTNAANPPRAAFLQILSQQNLQIVGFILWYGFVVVGTFRSR